MRTVERVLTLGLLCTIILSGAGCGNEGETLAHAPAVKAHGDGLQINQASLSMLDVQVVSEKREPRIVWTTLRVAFRDDRVAYVDAPVSGRIIKVHARIGDIVHAGTALATLTSPEAARIRAENLSARVHYQRASAEAIRQREMFDMGVGTGVDQFAAEAQRKEAQAELDRAERTASYLGDGEHDRFILRSPRDGVIVARSAMAGATTKPAGEPMFVVGDPDAVWGVAEVFESDMAGLCEGAGARIELSALSGGLSGHVQRVGAVANEANGRIPIFITFDGVHSGIRPGMLGRVGIEVPRETALMIPLSAVLIKDEQRSIVYVQRSQTQFESRIISLGRPSDGSVPVLNGLKPGDRIVVRGALLLDGAANQLM